MGLPIREPSSLLGIRFIKKKLTPKLKPDHLPQHEIMPPKPPTGPSTEQRCDEAGIEYTIAAEPFWAEQPLRHSVEVFLVLLYWVHREPPLLPP